MRFLSVEEVLRIHARVIDEAPPEVERHAGVRQLGSIASALERAEWGPFQQGDICERAALLLRGIALDHPFEDGNKRAAYAAAYAFLDANGMALAAKDDDITELMVGVARGNLRVDQIAEWIRARLENV